MRRPAREDLIYPELSYQIVGVLFEVFNKIGSGHHEKHYQRAVVIGLKNAKLLFEEQACTPLFFKEEKVGTYFLDFFIRPAD